MTTSVTKDLDMLANPIWRDAARYRALRRNSGQEVDMSSGPGKPKNLRITINCEGCERYLESGSPDYPATLDAALDAEIKEQPGSFRKKPIVIQAVCWLGGDYKHLERFCGLNWGRADAKNVEGPNDAERVVVWSTAEGSTAEGQWLNVPVGHWIIRGINGELYPCAPDIFEATYERV